MVYRLEFRPLRSQDSASGGNEGKDKGTPRHQGTEPKGVRRSDEHNRGQRRHGHDDMLAHLDHPSRERINRILRDLGLPEEKEEKE